MQAGQWSLPSPVRAWGWCTAASTYQLAQMTLQVPTSTCIPTVTGSMVPFSILRVPYVVCTSCLQQVGRSNSCAAPFPAAEAIKLPHDGCKHSVNSPASTLVQPSTIGFQQHIADMMLQTTLARQTGVFAALRCAWQALGLNMPWSSSLQAMQYRSSHVLWGQQ